MKPTGPWPPLFSKEDLAGTAAGSGVPAGGRAVLAPRKPGGQRYHHVGSRVYTARHIAVVETAAEAGQQQTLGWDVYQLANVAKDWERAHALSSATFASLCLQSEVFLRQAIAGTQHLGTPNPLRTAACCLVFQKLASTECRDLPVLRLIYEELLCSVYSVADGDPLDFDPEPSLEWHLAKTLWFDRFKAMRESFLRYHSVAEIGSKIMSRQQLVLGKAIRTWQNMLVARHLRAWRQVTLRIRRVRLEKVLANFKKMQRRMLRERLWQWRAYVFRSIEDKQAQLKREEEARTEKKILAAREEVHALEEEVVRLTNDRQLLEEELTRHKEMIEQHERELDRRAARIAHLERQRDGWRETCADLAGFAWPQWSAGPRELFPALKYDKQQDGGGGGGGRGGSAGGGGNAHADRERDRDRLAPPEDPMGLSTSMSSAPADDDDDTSLRLVHDADLGARLTEAAVASPDARMPTNNRLAALGLDTDDLTPESRASRSPAARAASTDTPPRIVSPPTPSLSTAARYNRETLARDERHLCRHPPGRMPALQLLLVWVGKLIHAQRPDAPIPDNIGIAWRDGEAYCHFMNEIVGGSDVASDALSGELSDLHRTEMVFAAMKHVVRYDSFVRFVTPLDVLNSHVDANYLLLYDMLREAFLPHPRGAVTMEGRSVARAMRELPDGADVSPFRAAVNNMIKSVKQWQVLFKPLSAAARSVLQSRFKDPESKVFMDDARKKERAAFTTVSQVRMRDIYEERNMAPAEQLGAKVALEEVLKANFETVQSIWRTYACTDGTLMSADKFWLFVSNTGSVDRRRLPRAAVAGIFKTANEVVDEEETAGANRLASSLGRSNRSGEGGDDDSDALSDASDWEGDAAVKQEAYNPADELTAHEWMDCVIHFAARRGVPDVPLELQLEEYFTHIASSENLVLSHVREFRDQIYRDDVQRTLAQYNDSTSQIFQHYASLGSQARGMVDGGSDTEISYVEFRQLLRDARLIDSVLTNEVSVEMFNFLQDDDPEGVPVKKDGSSMGTRDAAAGVGYTGHTSGVPSPAMGLAYREFLEVIVCLSIYKYPAPYMRLADRVQMFLSQRLIANLKGIVPNLGKKKKAKKKKAAAAAAME